MSKLKHVLRSDTATEIPMLEERLTVLKEAGSILMQKYDGRFINLLKRCNKSAKSLIELVLQDFTSFRDTASYNGQQVFISKRVQILVADYRIPQILAYFGALEYSEKLKK